MRRSEELENKERKCLCPYCEQELVMSALPFCQPCSVTLRYCVVCQIAVVKEATACPQCGGKLEWK